MSEVRKGILYKKQTKKGPRTFIRFETNKGKMQDQPLPRSQSQAGDSLLADVEIGHEIDVDFEFVNSNIEKVRAAGARHSVPAGTSFHNPYNFVPSTKSLFLETATLLTASRLDIMSTRATCSKAE